MTTNDMYKLAKELENDIGFFGYPIEASVNLISIRPAVASIFSGVYLRYICDFCDKHDLIFMVADNEISITSLS